MGELPLNQIICGDCLDIMQPFPSDSVDLVVTSPPYWGLRDYGSETMRVWGGLPECEHEWGELLPAAKSGHKNIGFDERSQQNYRGGGHKTVTIAKKYCPSESGQFCTKCGAWRGSLGLEPHPQLFIDNLVDICREIKRVLKPSGTFWINLGDTYYGSHAGKIPQAKNPNVKIPEPPSSIAKGNWLQPKQLLGMPWRVAIALQNDGWILRNDIIWFKPNHMPSSVKDRLSNAYEHVFLFAKNRRYYFDLDAIRKPFSEGTLLRIEQPNIDNQPGGPTTIALRGDKPKSGNANRPIDIARELSHKFSTGERIGKNPGDVWEIAAPIISDSRKALHGPTYRRHQISIKGGQAIGLSPKGKNPGDVWDIKDEKLTKHDESVGRRNRSYTDPLHKKEYNPKGKNPGDVLSGSKYLEQDNPHSIRVKGGNTGDYTNPKGKNPGDLWRIPTTPFPGAHFATFPPKLIEPIIKAGCPQWICSKCRKPRVRITEPTPEYAKKIGKSVHDHKDDLKRGMRYDKVCNAEYVTVGWSDCGCGANWVSGVVLDPFAGSGTALRVAHKLGRGFIGIEINPEYAAMCERRLRADTYQPPPEKVQPLTEIFDNE